MLALRDQELALEDYLGTLFTDAAAETATAGPMRSDARIHGTAPATDPLRVVRFRSGPMVFAFDSEMVKRVVPLHDVESTFGTLRWQGIEIDVIDLLALVISPEHPQRRALMDQQQPKYLLILDVPAGPDGRSVAVQCDEWLGGLDVARDQLCPNTEPGHYPWLAATFRDGSGALLDAKTLLASIPAPGGVWG